MARCDLNLGKTWRGEDVGEIVRRWISEVSKRYRLKMVIAIGSRVEGRAKPWSDVDLVVVVENPPKDSRARWHDFRVDGCLIVEPRVYGEEEFLEALRNLDLSALEAMHHGLIILDEGFYERARRVYEEVVKEWELQRTKIGWLSLRRLRETQRKRK